VVRKKIPAFAYALGTGEAQMYGPKKKAPGPKI